MDVLALLLITLGVLMIGVVVWIAVRGPGPGPEPPPAPDIPTFRVVALGLNGAGKTVLLASQFHKLSEPVADRRYFLDGHWEQDTRLAMIYASVGDTSAPWPAGTRIGDTREFLFDCKAFNRTDDERSVFRISYLDYAGDLLETDADEHTAKGELEARVDNAHALLVIIDGRRVLELLRDELDGRDYFDRIRPLLGLARKAKCPVQLIVTKWDLVRSFDESSDDEDLLRHVSKRLTAFGHINALVRAHDQRQQEVRLIPVSAVGSEFAELCDDGRVVKRRDGTLNPIHVDVPLCAVLPDVLKQVARSLDPAVRTRLDTDIGGRVLVDVSALVTSVLSSHVGMVLRGALRGVVGEEVVKLFVEMMVPREPRGRDSPVEDDAGETQRLRAEVIEHMDRVVLLFEARLPSSTLSGRW
jgi:hypothetical protein